MLGFGTNLVTTIIGFGLSATFIVFICARLICGRIRSVNSRPAAFDLELHSDLDPREHTINGLEPAVIAALPTVKYNSEAFRSRDDAQCSICLGEYEGEDMLRVIPTCGHTFHLACIDIWLKRQSTCPICRLPLNDSFEVTYTMSPLVGVLQMVDSPEFPNDHSRQWLLPSHRRSGGRENNQEIHESVSINLDISRGEESDARR